MSSRTIFTPSTSPSANNQAVIPATSTVLIDALHASSTESDTSQPTLSNKEAPESPLDAVTHSTMTAHSVLEHSAPENRDPSGNSLSATTQLSYSTLSIATLTKAASERDAVAMYELGKRFHRGTDIPINFKEAMEWYFRSAEQGYCNAQHNLGEMHLRGQGVEKNSHKAVEWFTKAANQGYAYSKYKLSLLFYNGQGVEKNDVIAFTLWLDLAEQGAKYVQTYLSRAYKDGNGVQKNLNRSVYWQMKHNLNDDGNCIQDKFLDMSLSSGLTEFIVKNLIEEKEFKKVTKLDFTKNKFSDDEILGVCKLIRQNLVIQSLILDSFDTLSDENLRLIIEALEVNNHITEFYFADYFVDSKIKDKIDALLARNVAIAELRKYVLDYPLIHTASFALDPLNIIVDKTIVSYMINGVSKEDTKLAIDELLRLASVYKLEVEVKNKVN